MPTCIKCNVCKYRFVIGELLKIHIVSSHMKICENCKKNFRKCLKKHIYCLHASNVMYAHIDLLLVSYCKFTLLVLVWNNCTRIFSNLFVVLIRIWSNFIFFRNLQQFIFAKLQMWSMHKKICIQWATENAHIYLFLYWNWVNLEDYWWIILILKVRINFNTLFGTRCLKLLGSSVGLSVFGWAGVACVGFCWPGPGLGQFLFVGFFIF